MNRSEMVEALKKAMDKWPLTLKKKFIFRFFGICTGGSRQCGWTGKYLEVSVSGCKGWRWNLPDNVCDSGINLWIYAFNDRGCHR